MLHYPHSRNFFMFSKKKKEEMMEIMMGAKYRMTFFVCVLNCVCCFGELEDKREAMKAALFCSLCFYDT